MLIAIHKLELRSRIMQFLQQQQEWIAAKKTVAHSLESIVTKWDRKVDSGQCVCVCDLIDYQVKHIGDSLACGGGQG